MALKMKLNLSKKPLIGMIHLPSFPSTMRNTTIKKKIFSQSIKDAQTLENAGFNAILIENYFNSPFPKSRLNDYDYLFMSSIVNEIISTINIPCGINILRNCCLQALIMATVNQASFIRCNIWEGAYVTDQGIIEGFAEKVISKRKELDSDVIVLADIHVKHATPLGMFSMEDAAKNALYRGKADAIVVSGKETGKIIEIDKLKDFTINTGIKPILGSGVSLRNVSNVFSSISGAIVGSSIKKADISTPIDPEKAKSLVSKWKNLL
ncbi:MAG: BtpA/SgcQ family protein [Candidatus Hodarchaeota archaeon]